MLDDDIYTFHINAYTPETIPMARLAEYMAALAEMLGEKDRVHFTGLAGGSTRVLMRVEREAAPKARANVSRAHAERTGVYKKVNDMLRDDRADADLSLAGDNIVRFPGRLLPRPPRMGPFTQAFQKAGELVRVGGTDRTAHATIQDSEGETWSFEVSRDLAVRLSPHLYSGRIRMIGSARWSRNDEGVWEHTSLRAQEFIILKHETLEEVVGRIRELPSDTWGDDPMAQLQRLRDEDEHGLQ